MGRHDGVNMVRHMEVCVLGIGVMRCISAELLYVCQTIGVSIGKWLPD